MKLTFSAVFKTGSTAPGKEGPVLLSSAAELSSFGYFQRSSIKEMFMFFSRTFAKNVTAGQRTSVKHEGFLCHMYASPGGALNPARFSRPSSGATAVAVHRQASPPFALRTLSIRRGWRSATCRSCAKTSCRPRVVASPNPARMAAWMPHSRCQLSAHPTTISLLLSPPLSACRGSHTLRSSPPLPLHVNKTNHTRPAPVQAHPKLLTQFQDPGQADQLTKIMSELEQTKVVLHDTIEAALERGQKIDTCSSGSYELAQGHPSGPASWGHMWQKSKIFLSHAA